MQNVAEWLPLVSRSVVVGILGGAGLVLTMIYSRRGPMMYPVYAAILFALAMVSARFGDLPFATRLSGILSGMVVSTGIAFVTVLVRAARTRQRLRDTGRPMLPGRAPSGVFR
jgi:hypothetical protein